MKINIGETCLEVTQTRHAKLEWGGANELSLTAFNDQGRTVQCGERSITRSGNCKGQIINLVKIIGDEARPGNYYFSAKVGDKTADFEWEKPEIVSNSLATPPDSTSIETLKDPTDIPVIILPSEPKGGPVLLPAPNTPPASNKTAKVEETKLADPSTDSDGEVEELRMINSRQTSALDILDKFGALPHWMNNTELTEMTAKAEEVQRKHPDDKTAMLLARQIIAREKTIKTALALQKLAKATAPKPSPAKQKPEPKPATTPDDSPARGQEDEGRIPIVSRVEKLEKRADQTDKDLDAVGSLAAKGINELTRAIADLKPSTPPASGGTPPPQQPIIQHFHYPQSKDNAGTGGDGDDSSGNGGKASADKNPPKSADRSWIMLLLGILGTLLLLIGVGGWIVSSLLGGWILGSKAPTAGFMPAMIPPVIMITNTVTPVTPPAVQQAVQSTTASSPEEIANIADEMKAIRAGQAEFLEKERGLMANSTTKPEKAKSEMTIGDGNIVAGRDVTVVNNYYVPPTSSGNGGQVTVTSPPKALVTQSETSNTGGGPQSREDRPAHTAPHWSSTLMTGFICVPVAADGSGSEGFWVYQDPPVPGQTT